MSPASTLSPTALVHCTILPSFIVDESAGIEIWLTPLGSAALGAAGAAAAAAAGAG
eukprot:CAMPEP_0172152778 /NCGR_PEP_ID=MMETSP1050-20130122/1048_1 /TAXON_ID=233186 /ORGANISM="Cryptomonas curvata, Strain CCAP979/52" /LENGTH=55 /DNA_ID=CAMNT_0012821181 /DNA_START=17 /DNA_END=180 /DNA_ORIENTATION=-